MPFVQCILNSRHNVNGIFFKCWSDVRTKSNISVLQKVCTTYVEMQACLLFRSH